MDLEVRCAGSGSGRGEEDGDDPVVFYRLFLRVPIVGARTLKEEHHERIRGTTQGPHTMQTYQHLLPGMQDDAASAAERLARPVPPAEPDTVERRRNNRRKTA